jgi:hypothetical protein
MHAATGSISGLTPYFAEALVELADVEARLGNAERRRDDARYFGANRAPAR